MYHPSAMPDIFVSYASEDLERVKPLVAAFEEKGWSVWWDRELIAGPSYEDKIEEALDEALSVVVVWSNQSVKSQWVRTEAHEGMERKILVPLLIDDVKPPLAYRIAQTAKMFNWPDQSGQLETVIDGISELVGIPPPSDQEPATVNQTQQNAKKTSRLKVTALVIISLIVIGTLLMSIESSKRWIVQTATSLAFDIAAALSTSELEVQLGIAVLPFANMSNDPDNEYFSDGISEEILDAVVKMNRLPVIARTSSFQFKGKSQDIKEIGRILGVTHILEGSVRKANNRVRITAQLIDVATGKHLWSDTYERELLDVFAIQDEIAEKITAQIGQAIMPNNMSEAIEPVARGTSSMEAYELYLKARHLVGIDNPLEMKKAIPLFRQAIALDDNFADAWAELAFTQVKLSFAWAAVIPAEVLPEAISAARKALEINPNHARAMGSLGLALIQQEFKWNEGARLLAQSLALNPLDAELQAMYGYFLICTRQEVGASFVNKAYRLNPLDPIAVVVKARHLQLTGEGLAAVSLMETLFNQNQQGYYANFFVAAFASVAGKPDLVKRHLIKARDVVGADYAGIRFLEFLVAVSDNNSELLEEIRLELLDRGKRENIFLFHLLAQTPGELVDLWDIQISHRSLDWLDLFGPKPVNMPEADWQRIKNVTRIAEVDLGSNYLGGLRTEAEKEQLKLKGVTLSDKELEMYVGEYKETVRGFTVKIDRSGKALNLDYSGTIIHAIPMSSHNFQSLEFQNQSFEFTVVDGQITGFDRQDSDAVVRKFIKL